MPVVTLTPNTAAHSPGGGEVQWVGASLPPGGQDTSAQGAMLADANDSTYVRSRHKTLYIDYDVPVALRSAAITKIVPKMRHRATSLGFYSYNVNASVVANGETVVNSYSGSSVFLDLEFVYKTVHPFDSTHSPPLFGVNFLSHQYFLDWDDSNTPPIDISKAELEVTFVTAPTAVISAPSSTIYAELARPDITWSPSLDPTGGPQTHYQVDIVDVDNDVVNTSGVVSGAATTWQATVDLDPGAYTARVRLAQTVNGAQHWGPWTTKSFSIVTTPQPTIRSAVIRPGTARWSFIYTDYAFRPQGEITNAYDRKVSRPISKLSTASFRIRLDHPLAQSMAACDGYVKAYRNGRLEFFGPVVTAEYTAEGEPSVAVNCVSAGWVLGKRLAGKSATGTQFSTPTDRAQIIRSLIATANAEDIDGLTDAGETGIAIDGEAGSGSAITYTAGPYRPIVEIINELATAFEGFEWQINPRENVLDGEVVSRKIGTFVAKPKGIEEFNQGFGFGQQRHEAIFEWGLGRHNIKTFRRSVTRDTQVNRGFHFREGGTPLTVSSTNTDSIQRYGLLEDLVQVDLTTESLRQQFVSESVRVRANPRQIIEFTPGIDNGLTGRVPQYGLDYELGDLVRARARYRDNMLYDAWFRIWGMSFEIDANGRETGAFALVEESTG